MHEKGGNGRGLEQVFAFLIRRNSEFGRKDMIPLARLLYCAAAKRILLGWLRERQEKESTISAALIFVAGIARHALVYLYS